MNIIIIEGMDNTGKTTFAKVLAERLGYNYVSGGGPEVGKLKGAMERLLLGTPNKVQDRTWLSEMIYGPIIRGRSGISDKEAMEFIDFFRKNKVVLIYAKRSYDEIMENIDERDQMSGVVEHAKELMVAYDYWMHVKLPRYKIIPIIFNYSINKVEDIVKTINYFHMLPEDIKIKEFNPGGPSLTDG